MSMTEGMLNFGRSLEPVVFAAVMHGVVGLHRLMQLFFVRMSFTCRNSSREGKCRKENQPGVDVIDCF